MSVEIAQNVMICSQCKQDKAYGELENNVYTCNVCICHNLVKPVRKKLKPKDPNYAIIKVLTNCGIEWKIAMGLYRSKSISTDQIIKAIWLFTYRKYTGAKIENEPAFLIALVRNTYKFAIPEDFWSWYKGHMAKAKDSIMYRSVF